MYLEYDLKVELLVKKDGLIIGNSLREGGG